MRRLGNELLELCSLARGHVLLVAPFIKVRSLERVIGAINSSVHDITCVTRWRPEEIAAGVSDLEVFDLVESRSGAKLLIQPWLHGKLFKVDDVCLVGSCNLTDTALGWRSPSNLELMLRLSADSEAIRMFEKEVLTTSFPVTKILQASIRTQVDEIRSQGLSFGFLDEGLPPNELEDSQIATWLPLCRRPEELFRVYSGNGIDQMVHWTVRSGQQDIASLAIPPGLAKEAFELHLVASLVQTYVFALVSEKIEAGIAPEQGAVLIESVSEGDNLPYPSSEHWEVMKRWLLYFLPFKFRLASGSDTLLKGAKIGEFNL